MKKKVVDSTEKIGDGVRAVERALAILLAFSPDDEELSAIELAKRAELSRPTFYRLINSLERYGFIRALGDPQRFRLGPAIAKLGLVWNSTLNVAEVARPILRNVWQASGETVALFVPQDGRRLCVLEMPSPEPLSFKRGVGYSEAIVLGASGRAIVAFSGVDRDELENYAAQAGLDMHKLLAELEQVRRRGYASSRNELIQGAVAVATPIFNNDGSVAGSIAIFGPEVRMDEAKIKELSRLLLITSATLSQELGYDGALPGEAGQA